MRFKRAYYGNDEVKPNDDCVWDTVSGTIGWWEDEDTFTQRKEDSEDE